MRSKRLTLLLSCLILTLGSCTTITVEPVLPCPARPLLQAITVEEQQLIDPQVISKLRRRNLTTQLGLWRVGTRASPAGLDLP